MKLWKGVSMHISVGKKWWGIEMKTQFKLIGLHPYNSFTQNIKNVFKLMKIVWYFSPKHCFPGKESAKTIG